MKIKSHDKVGMELSQNSSSSASDYSEDTFESFSEEENRPSDPYSREDLEGSDILENPSCLTAPSPAGSCCSHRKCYSMSDSVEFVEHPQNRAEESKKSGIEQDKSGSKTPVGIPALFHEELAALSSFCSRKINGMSSKQENTRKSRKQQPGIPGTGNCSVPRQLMNRILLENTRHTLSQVTKTQIHEAAACPECQRKEGELAKIAFLRRKKTLLESALIQERLEEQIYSRDVLTLLGEALRSLPRPSENPREFWKSLKGQEM